MNPKEVLHGKSGINEHEQPRLLRSTAQGGIFFINFLLFFMFV